MAQIQNLTHSTWNVCRHPTRHGKERLAAIGGLAVAAGVTASLVLATVGNGDQLNPSGSLVTATGAPVSTVSEVTPDPTAALVVASDMPRAIVVADLTPSGMRFDEAAGVAIDGELVFDEAAGMAVYPRAATSADVTTKASPLYVDEAVGLYDTRRPSVVANLTPTGVRFDEAAGMVIVGELIFDEAAGMAVYPTS